MNIDVGESLCASWLKRCKGCFVVQTNWRMLNSCINSDDEIKGIVEGVEVLLRDRCSVALKRTKTGKFVYWDVECDVLGLSLPRNQDPPMPYAVEIACHLRGKGLHYSAYDKNQGKKMNVSVPKVCSKMLKIALSIYGITGLKRGTFIFVSPFVSCDIKDAILECFKTMEEGLREHDFDTHFVFYGNDDFYTKIEQPALKAARKGRSIMADELYLRSVEIHDFMNAGNEAICGRKKF